MTDVPEGVRGLLTGGLVDVDIFADHPVQYGLTDVRGEHHDFEIPVDLPLPLALRVQRSYDGFIASVEQSPEEIEAAWAKLLEAFAEVVSIRTEGWTGERLGAELGQNKMLAWVNVVIERLRFQQTQLTLEEYLRQQLAPPKPEEETDPKAESSGSST